MILNDLYNFALQRVLTFVLISWWIFLIFYEIFKTWNWFELISVFNNLSNFFDNNISNNDWKKIIKDYEYFLEYLPFVLLKIFSFFISSVIKFIHDKLILFLLYIDNKIWSRIIFVKSFSKYLFIKLKRNNSKMHF